MADQPKPNWRRGCFKLALTDEWYPPYQLNGWHNGVKDPWLVEVSFIHLTDTQWRVCVWGGDDFGMERDYPDNERDKAEAMFNSLLEEKHISVSLLKKQGFVNA